MARMREVLIMAVELVFCASFSADLIVHSVYVDAVLIFQILEFLHMHTWIPISMATTPLSQCVGTP